MKDKQHREQVSFDAFYFEKASLSYNSMKEIFEHIFHNNLWGAEESVSGEGSTEKETKELIQKLEALLNKYKIKTILDAPCGDFSWLSKLSFNDIHYIGMDIINTIVDKNCSTYLTTPNFQFTSGDLTEDTLPCVDIILCRDCLVHFSHKNVFKALQNFKKSGSTYLLTTTFVECTENTDIVTGDWNVLNLQLPPFNLPKPLDIITENCQQNNGLYKDKSLGLWELSSIHI